MASDVLNIDGIRQLPLWAQVLIASRMARRAAYALPADVPAKTRQLLIDGCDAVDRCARAGEWLEAEKPAIETAKDHQPVRAAQDAAMSFYYVADATHAAHASLDFSAADGACMNSSYNALVHASQSPGLSPIQVRIFAAADMDQLRFACKEARVGQYDALGPQVMGRIVPVYPPDPQVANQSNKTHSTDGNR